MGKSATAIIISLVLAAAAVVIVIQLTGNRKSSVRAAPMMKQASEESQTESRATREYSGSSSGEHKKLFPKRASRSGLSDSWKLSLDMTERLTSHGAILKGVDRPMVSFDPAKRIGARSGIAMLRAPLTPPSRNMPQMINPNFE